MNDFVELRQVVQRVIRWWWLLILATVVTTVVGYEVSRRQPPVYEATVTVVVGRFLQAAEVDRGDLQASEMLAQTYADLAKSQPVLEGAIEALGLDTGWQILSKKVNADLVQGTQLIRISVRDTNSKRARILTDEIARQLILLSPTRGQDENQQFVLQQLETLRAKIESGQERLAAKEREIAGSLTVERRQKLQGEINTLEGLIVDWENSYTQFLAHAKSEQSPNYLTVVGPAYASSDPIRPRLLINTTVAGAVGLVLALGLILLLEFLGERIRSPDELSQSLNLPALGTISRIKGEHYWNKLVTLQESSPVAEAYRMIRSNIQFMSADRSLGAILVTSPMAREGKSVTAANLGVAMAQAGFKTIIVDTNLRQPVLHQIFQMPNRVGLAELLRSPELEIGNHLRNTGLQKLQVLTSGERPTNPSELLSSRRMEQLMDNLNQLADVIIYDSPPALSVTDAAVLANRVNGVVLVIDAGKTRAGTARQAISNLQYANAKFLGGVLNRFPKKYYQAYYTSDRPKSPDPAVHFSSQRWWQRLPFSSKPVAGRALQNRLGSSPGKKFIR